MRHWIGWFLSGALLLALAQQDTWKLVNTAVNESSGVVASVRYKETFWTHNDSGDGPNLYAFDRAGKDLGTFSLRGIQVLDCEDMALLPKQNGNSYLYLGDIGDNARRRAEIVVYRLKEPEPDPKGAKHTVANFETFRLKYPDGAHDCETLMVHPQRGDLYVVTKEADGKSRVYKLASPKASPEVQTLTHVATVEFTASDLGDRLTTGGDIAPDGKRVVIRTYVAAYEFTLSEGKPFDAIFSTVPRRIPFPAQEQGEAICYLPDGKNLLITSEGVPCVVQAVPIRYNPKR